MPDTDQAGIRSQALPLTGPASLDPLMERIGDAHYVLLGEASHGTADYYQVRDVLTRRLIEEKRLLLRRRGGRLAGLPVRALLRGGRAGRTRGPRRGADGLRPLAHVDVGQHRGRRVRPVAAPAQRATAARTARGLLRTRRLQPVGVAARRARPPARARPRPGAARPGGVPLLRAVRRGAAVLRAGHPLSAREL
ncbi:hypothetical protein LT493_00695 [Streptomyces tricolor]|nr:hypothetical protein [Streptomyces tricolor]